MSANPSNAVRLTKLIKAPRDKVYNAWVDPETRRQWWCAAPGMSCGFCEMDATEGGAYRINMLGPDGKEWVTTGAFVELDPPRKLRFSWNWEHDATFGGNSVVTVEFFATTFNDQPATELVLTHEKLGSPFERSEHTVGWMGALHSLDNLFQPQTAARSNRASDPNHHPHKLAEK